MRLMQRSRPKHSGYSLLEMLIVVAVVMLLATLSWPALRRPLGKTRLRQAAKQLRAELIRARLEAIRSGKPQQFRYQPGTGRYETGPCLAVQQERSAPSAQRAALALLESGDDVASETASQQSSDPVLKQIDEQIAFVDPASAEAQGSLAPAAGSAAADASANTVGGGNLTALPPGYDSAALPGDATPLADGQQWSAPLVFYPDGRASSNARIRLAGRDGYYLDVFVRGITGTTLVGQVKQPPKPEEKQPWRVEPEAVSP